MRWIGLLLVIVLGVAAIVYGGHDDSPGLQGIGLLLAVGALAWGMRTILRRGPNGP